MSPWEFWAEFDQKIQEREKIEDAQLFGNSPFTVGEVKRAVAEFKRRKKDKRNDAGKC